MTPPEPFLRAEGYLDLGMPAEANAELEELPAHFHLTERWTRLRKWALDGLGDAERANVIGLLVEDLPGRS